MTYNDTQLSKWAQDYEKEITAKYDFIVDRLSIQIISGQGTYELPNYVTNIRSVLYLGKELHPKGGRASILTGDIPFATSQTAPYEYQTSGLGLHTIKLLPTPGDNIAVYVPAAPLTLFSIEADKAACIVEFYRTAHYDLYDHTKMLPFWMRRWILRDQVCWKAFTSEGAQQDTISSSFYADQREQNEVFLKNVQTKMFMAYQRILADNKMISRRKPGRPVLPPTFGYPTYGG